MARRFTKKQGQYLAFIDGYTRLHRRPPAEADIQGYSRVTPPTVHNMILRLERLELISREPGKPRSMHALVDEEDIPRLVMM